MKKSILKPINALLVILIAGAVGSLCASELTQVSHVTNETFTANAVFGPGTLPPWAADADVKLGWDFVDSFRPNETSPLLDWNITIGETPKWSYDINRKFLGDPAQWYIRIPNLYNEIELKHFWLCWNYEFDAFGEGLRSTTNLEWFPVSDYENFQYEEQLYDANGNPTSNNELGVLAQGIMSVDILSNPEYEDIWLGLFNDNMKVLEVYIMVQCVEEPTPETFGPGPLPSWAADADLKLGWAFIDSFRPNETSPLLDWNITIGETPEWSYDINREFLGDPAQWYIRIPNLYDGIELKHFWLCWNYEFDAFGEGLRSTTNLEWFPVSDFVNFQYNEQLYDANGNPTTNHEDGVLAQGIMSVDILSNPEYEDIWLGLFNDNKKVLEVYIMVQCVEELISEAIGPGALPDWHSDAQTQLGWDFDDPTKPQDTNPLRDWSKTIGVIPTWDYDPDRVVSGQKAQWYIRIPNLINDYPSKKFWISWIYEYDSSLTGPQYWINLTWYPYSGMADPTIEDELLDSEGNPTTDTSQAVYERVTGSLDLYPNPEYEDLWLGVYGDSKNVVEVYIDTLCVEEPTPVTIGPGTLPDWHLDAQVQLGWDFDDPTRPQDTSPLPNWDKAIGGIPTWDYDPDRVISGQKAQWYIRIPNVINDYPSKKVWISWIYEYDSSLTGPQYWINLTWYPNSGMENAMSEEELLDSEGNPTTDTSQAVYGRMTGSLDLLPNPEYEDIWLGVYGDSKNVVEVYIDTLCVEETEPEPEPETEIDILIDTQLSFSANENTELRQTINVSSSSTEIKIIIDIKQNANEVPKVNLKVEVSGSVADTDISIDIDQSDQTTSVKVSLEITMVGSSNDIDVSLGIDQSGSFTDFTLSTDIQIGT